MPNYKFNNWERQFLCRRLKYGTGIVSTRVAFAPRSAEIKPLFWRFVPIITFISSSSSSLLSLLLLSLSLFSCSLLYFFFLPPDFKGLTAWPWAKIFFVTREILRGFYMGPPP